MKIQYGLISCDSHAQLHKDTWLARMPKTKFGDRIPHDLLQALPYLATVFGVWLSGKLRGGAKAASSFAELRDQ